MSDWYDVLDEYDGFYDGYLRSIHVDVRARTLVVASLNYKRGVKETGRLVRLTFREFESLEFTSGSRTQQDDNTIFPRGELMDSTIVAEDRKAITFRDLFGQWELSFAFESATADVLPPDRRIADSA
jgi:hypothetical protein